jgi:hypothetical protein
MDEQGDISRVDDPASEHLAGASCPRCGAADVRPILYGFPSSEAIDAADRGELVLGGCVVSEDDPDIACRACGLRFVGRRRHRSRR